MRNFAVIICLLMLLLVGCTAKITGSVQIDGAPFTVTQCRSGRAFAFNGVELSDANGRRLRLFANPDGTSSGALFQGNNVTGDRLGECGVLSMETQPSRINSINNIKGVAKLSCDSGLHKVTGTVEFENCH
jgi:hypothetical protein